VLHALTDPDHASIILFSLMIGGMVGIISRNGGMQGVVNRLLPLASSPQRGQGATGLLGVIIFFDDYANTLIVGNTMRQVTDRLRVSREKLAYIVDSTAAPVTCVALVSTWIGYEVGLIGEAVQRLEGYNEAPYSVFLGSIAYSFYPLLAMFFVFLVAFSGRDFGPMFQAEVRARTTGQVLAPDASVDDAAGGASELIAKEDHPERAFNALIPIFVLIAGVLTGLWVTGEGETLREVVGNADSYKALMWASLLGALTAGALSIAQRILTLGEVVDAWYAGLKAMLIAMIILVLAWSLSSVTEVLHTAGYLVSVLGDWLAPGLVPALVFVLSAATAFATGSSWGTMGILMPLVIPLVWAVLVANNVANSDNYHIIYSTAACVLGGAVWGDHCSPISDTTILSSMASGCDHIDHVRTQLPYAMLVGGVGILVGTIPTGFGFPWWLSLPIGASVLFVAHRFLSKPVDVEAAEAT
jgi:Na+/H+ antiporter NhaC